MKCFIENFLELDIDGLLAVNGGYGSSSKSYGTTSSSGSGNQSSWEVWDANKDGRNSSGEITRPHDPYRDTPNNSGTYKSTSSGADDGKTGGDYLSLKDIKDKILENLLSPENADNEISENNSEFMNENNEDSNVVENPETATETLDSIGDEGNVSAILDSINENGDHIYNENGNGYCCDNWVEEVLSDAGYNPSDFMAGDSTATVQEHINNLEDGEFSTSVPNEEGAYVVFMNNSENSDYDYVPHAGILTVEADGTMTFHHNSSSNENNGVASEVITSFNGTTFDGYGYDSFYFQEIN